MRIIRKLSIHQSYNSNDAIHHTICYGLSPMFNGVNYENCSKYSCFDCTLPSAEYYLYRSIAGNGILNLIAPSAGHSNTQALQCQHSSG